MTATKKLNALLLLAALLFPSLALADEVTASINRGIRDDVFIDQTADTIVTALQANRSYSCVMLNREYDSTVPKRFPAFNTTVTAPDATTFSASAVGTMKPGIAVPSDLAMQQANLRLSFIAQQTGRYSFTAFDANGSGTAVPGTTVKCDDTTLYGGYNRFFADLAIVELSNDTFTDITAFITIIDFSGNVLVNQQAAVVTANNRRDIIFRNELPAMSYGQIIITYVGSLGALSGYVSEYDQAGAVLTLKRERVLENLTPLP